jgi:5-methylcytosine-specific restriction protein A
MVQQRLPLETLIDAMPTYTWGRIQASGFRLPEDIAKKTEYLWKKHLSQLGIKAIKEKSQPVPAPIIPGEIVDATFREGQMLRVVVTKYERVPRARRICIEEYGCKCQVCDFDFERRYGEIGKDYIHVHHLREISSIGEEYILDAIRDLRPVCPNCHAMLHTSKPALTIAALKAIIRQRKRG